MTRNKKRFLMVFFVAALLSFHTFIIYGHGVLQAKINFVILYPGGPDPGTEGKSMITQFLDILTKRTSLKKTDVEGNYYNDIALAKAAIKRNGNAYIMGSLGFYLANQKRYNLVPLSLVATMGKNTESYYMVVKKGKYSSLSELKGKILGGNILYEDYKYIDSIIFNGQLNVAKYFKLKASSQVLGAVRRVIKGQIDAVLLNSMQYESLTRLKSTFENLQVIYTSQEVPRLGFMMADTSETKKVKDEILSTLNNLCSGDGGKSVCDNFGISGFQNIDSETLDDISKKFNSSN